LELLMKQVSRNMSLKSKDRAGANHG
jgi:hypothetical protein